MASIQVKIKIEKGAASTSVYEGNFFKLTRNHLRRLRVFEAEEWVKQLNCKSNTRLLASTEIILWKVAPILNLECLNFVLQNS